MHFNNFVVINDIEFVLGCVLSDGKNSQAFCAILPIKMMGTTMEHEGTPLLVNEGRWVLFVSVI